MTKTGIYKWGAAVLFALIIYFPLFLHLDSLSLHHWDEGRNAISAFEMYHNGNYVVRHYMGAPDTWETKPPLLIWTQVLAFKLFGFNELAVRLPAALAALGTILLIFFFFKNELKDIWTGCFAILTLITTQGYINFHVSRTGDHDSVLIFFLMLGFFSFYKFLYSEKNKQTKHLWLLAIATVCGVLTKSIAGFFFLPAYLCWVIGARKFEIFTNKNFYLGVLVGVSAVAAYYLLNESLNPGYIELVWNNELFPRYINSGGSHNQTIFEDKWYYVKIIKNKLFSPYVWALPLSVLAILFLKKIKHRSFYILTILSAFVFLFIISMGTKNSWYAAPVYPLLAILFAKGCTLLMERLRPAQASSGTRMLIPSLFLLLIFAYPYYNIIEHRVYSPSDNPLKYGETLDYLSNIDPELKSFHVYYEWRNASYLFYDLVYNKTKGYNISSCGVRGHINKCPERREVGEKVIACNKKFIQQIHENYEAACKTYFKKCVVCDIQGIKTVEE